MRIRTVMAMVLSAAAVAVLAGAAHAPATRAEGRSLGWIYTPCTGEATELLVGADGTVALPEGSENAWASAEAHGATDLDR